MWVISIGETEIIAHYEIGEEIEDQPTPSIQAERTLRYKYTLKSALEILGSCGLS